VQIKLRFQISPALLYTSPSILNASLIFAWVWKKIYSAHLFDLEDLARKAHIPHYLVHDAGKNQVY